jgi:hypothetical protein
VEPHGGEHGIVYEAVARAKGKVTEVGKKVKLGGDHSELRLELLCG